MTFSSRRLFVGLALAAAMSAPVWADEPPVSPPPSTDVWDLWRRVRHKDEEERPRPAPPPEKRSFVLTPSLGSKPSTGLSLGFNGNTTFLLGDPRTTHTSSLSGGFKYSQKKQSLGNIRVATFTSEDRWSVQADARLWWTLENTFGLGALTAASTFETVKYDHRRVFTNVYHHLTGDLFAGAALNISDHGNVRPETGGLFPWEQSAFVSYNNAHGFVGNSQRSAGTGAALLFDSRDNLINPQRGVLASATYRTFFDGFLGGDSTWQELYVDARTYRNVTRTGTQKVALWLIGDFVTSGSAPYFDLPSIAASDRSARGYREGRYRGDQLVYGEIEYRGALTSNGLLGFVAFLNVTTIGSRETSDHLFDQYAPGAGLGLRVLLNKRSLTNLAVDYGWGKDGARGLYLGLQEAF